MAETAQFCTRCLKVQLGTSEMAATTQQRLTIRESETIGTGLERTGERSGVPASSTLSVRPEPHSKHNPKCMFLVS